MSVVADILSTYRHPRQIMRHRIGAEENESRALITVVLACSLIFVAQWPRLSRDAFETGQDFQMLVGGALFGWIFVMPLVLYCLTAVIAVIGNLLGAKASGYEVRTAMFWGLLAVSPLWLLSGLSRGFLGSTTGVAAIGAVALGALIVFWIAGLIEVFSTKEARV